MTKAWGNTTPFYFAGIIWVIFFIDALIPGFTFDYWGIRPRQLSGLTGIFISPFLHGNLFHLISNTIPLIILPLLVRLSAGKDHVTGVMILGGIGSGIGTWLFGLGGIVVGASGVVYALLGYLFGRAYFSPGLYSWAAALISLLLYSGAILSFLTINPYISWAAHFWGFVSGIAIAYAFRAEARQ